MIIMVGHEKGGVGKSTFAINLAYYLALNPKNSVVLADADQSRNAGSWAALRSESGLNTPFLVVAAPTDTANNVLKLAEKYNVVIVDIGAGDYARLVDLGRVADLWIAPTRTGQKDADSNVNLIEAANQGAFRHKNGKIPLCFAINQTPTSSISTAAKNTAAALREYAPEFKVLDQAVCLRAVYENADKAGGRTIFEMPPAQRQKAEAEFVEMANQALKAMAEFAKEKN